MISDRRRLPATATLIPLLSALLLTGVPAHAGTDEPRNHHVALVNGTDAQAPQESGLNSSAQTASRGGQFVVFSTAAALVEEDTNDIDDVYLRDVDGGVTVLVSKRNGFPGDDYSFEPTISADGRYVAFSSFATNLTGDSVHHSLQVVVKDMHTKRMEVASVTSGERMRNANSFYPVISDDGRSVSFQSFGRLGPRDGDRKEDVYVRDLDADRTRQASLLPGSDRDIRGSVLNGDLSADGSRVVFGTSNRLWVRDLSTGTTTRFWQEPDGPPCQPFPTGSAGRPALSGNGRYAAFASCATDLPGEDGEHTDVYRIDLGSGDIVRMHPEGDGNSFLPSLSFSGRFVGFGSEAADLVAGDDAGPDAFWADVRTGTVLRASQAADGTGGDAPSAGNEVAISTDGRALAYTTYADNLVGGDTVDLPEAVLWRR